MSSSYERRQAPRFNASYAVETDYGIGTTENLSLSGVYFHGPAAQVNSGDALHFSVVLDDEGSGELVLLQCHGRIIRTDQRDESTVAVAATIESFWFETWTKKSVLVN